MLRSSENCVKICHLFDISSVLPRVAQTAAEISTLPCGEDAGFRDGDPASDDGAGERDGRRPRPGRRGRDGRTAGETSGRPGLVARRERDVGDGRQPATTSRAASDESPTWNSSDIAAQVKF